MRHWKYIGIGVILLAAILFPFYSGAYPQHVGSTVLKFMALALSWDMLMRTGLLSFGVAGFFGIGGYAAALTHLNWGVSPLISIVLGGLAAGVVALGTGVVILRLRGVYFAIVTLALSFVFEVIVNNLPGITGGAVGKVLPLAIFGGDSAMIYWLTLAIAVAAIIVSEVCQRTRIHLAFTSIMNNEIIARTSGINIFKYLLFVFVVTSAIQGVVGGAFAQQYAFVHPASTFSIHFAVVPVVMVLFGGMFSTQGAVVGSVILGVLSEWLRVTMPGAHLLIYGLVMVAAIILMPKGVVGKVRELLQRRE